MTKLVPKRETIDPKDWSALKQFTNREDLINRFFEIHELTKNDREEYSFMVFYGVGGIGKSRLCLELLKRLQAMGSNDISISHLNFEGKMHTHPETFFFDLRQNITQNSPKFRFPVFDSCYTIYLQKVYKDANPLIGSKSNSFDGVLSEIVNFVSGGTFNIFKKTVNLGLKYVNKWKEWKKYGSNDFLNSFIGLEPNQMLNKLHKALAIDISANVDKFQKQLYLFLDTYEVIWGDFDKHTNMKSHELDKWFREFVIEIIDLTRRVNFFIFGREYIYWKEIDKIWGDIIEHHLIGYLSENDSIKYLTQVLIPPEFHNRIIEITEGLPLYLDISVDLYYNKLKRGEIITNNDFPRGHMDLINRFLLYIEDRNERDLIKLLVFTRKWDDELFSSIVTHYGLPFSKLYLGQFQKYSFIKAVDEQFFSIHSLMRQHLIDWITKKEPDFSKEIISLLIEYHSQRCLIEDPKSINNKILFHLEEKYYVEIIKSLTFGLNNFIDTLPLLNRGGHIAFGFEMLQNMITKLHEVSFCLKYKSYYWLTEFGINLGELSYSEELLNNILPNSSNLNTCEYYFLCNLNLARIYFITGNIHDSEKICESIQDESPDVFPNLHSKLMTLLGDLKFQKGDYKMAYDKHIIALEICKENNDLVGVSDSLCNLGDVMYAESKYQKASLYFEKALDINEKIVDKPGQSDILCSLGDVSFAWGNYEESFDYYSRSLKAREEISNVRGIGECYEKIGNYYHVQSDFKRAQDYYLKSLTIFRKLKDKHGTGISLSNLGRIFYMKGEYHQAEEYYKKSLIIRYEIEDKKGISVNLTNLANIKSAIGQNERSLEFLQKSLEIKEIIGDIQGIGIVLGDMGNIYYNWGKYSNALDYFGRNLSIKKKIGDTFGESVSLKNHGDVYFALAQYEKAQDYYNQSLTLKKQLNNIRGIAILNGKLGDVMYAKSNFNNALKYYTISYNLSDEIGDVRSTASNLNTIGEVKYVWGDYQSAMEYFQRSLTIQKKIENRQGVSISLQCIGDVLYQQGSVKEAEKYYLECLTIQKELSDKQNIAVNLGNLGDIKLAKNQFLEAEKYYIESLELRKEIEDKHGVSVSLNDLAELKILEKNLFKARDYVDRNLAIQREIGDRHGLAKSLGQLAKIKIELREYEAAISDIEEAEAILIEINSPYLSMVQQKKEEIENIIKTNK